MGVPKICVAAKIPPHGEGYGWLRSGGRGFATV